MRETQLVVVCDNIRSLENVGSIFRTADAFGIDKIFLCGITGTPDSRRGEKISKTALGADEYIPWEYHTHAWRVLERLKKEGVHITALEQARNSITLCEFRPALPLAIIIGNEVEGVSPSALARADAAIEIPMQGKKESLNAAVAFGIAAYHISTHWSP